MSLLTYTDWRRSEIACARLVFAAQGMKDLTFSQEQLSEAAGICDSSVNDWIHRWLASGRVEFVGYDSHRVKLYRWVIYPAAEISQ